MRRLLKPDATEASIGRVNIMFPTLSFLNRHLVVLIGCGNDTCTCCEGEEGGYHRPLLKTYWLNRREKLQEDGVVICSSCYVKHGKEALLIAITRMRTMFVESPTLSLELEMIGTADQMLEAIAGGHLTFPDIPQEAFSEHYAG